MSHTSLPHKHDHETEALALHLPPTEEFVLLAEDFKLLGDPTRLRLFWVLCHCEECLLNLAAIMEMSSPALSHHLRLLKVCGLVSSRRMGKEVYYKASDHPRVHALHESIKAMALLSCPNTHCFAE